MVEEKLLSSTASPQQTLIAYVEDKPGVLNRITALFGRRGFNIESLNVGKTSQIGVSRLTILMLGDDDTAKRFEANLYKLINVLRVINLTSKPAIERELALIKVTSNPDIRKELLQIAEVFRARIVDMGKEALVFEITETQKYLQAVVTGCIGTLQNALKLHSR